MSCSIPQAELVLRPADVKSKTQVIIAQKPTPQSDRVFTLSRTGRLCERQVLD